MAGSNQHYIPRFLLRGFLATDSEVWVHEPYRSSLVSIKKAAAEHEFYGSPGAGSLDERITNFENRGALRLNLFRSAHGSVDAEWAAKLFVHFAFRSKLIRSLDVQLFLAARTMIRQKFGDQTWLEKKMGVNKPRLNGRIGKMATEELRRRGVPAEIAPDLVSKDLGRVPDILSEIREELLEHLGGAPSSIWAESARSAHMQVLREEIAPSEHRELLQRFSWRVIPSGREGRFILPDCISVAFSKGGGALPYLLAEKDQIAAVAMPIASERLLVGTRNPMLIENVNTTARGVFVWILRRSRRQS